MKNVASDFLFLKEGISMGSLRYPRSWTKEQFIMVDGRYVQITDIPTVETFEPEPKMSAGIIIEDVDETRIYELLEED